MRNLGLFSLIITDIAVCSGLGVGLGYVFYAKYDAPWWVLFLTSIAGLVLAFYRLYRVIRKEAEREF